MTTIKHHISAIRSMLEAGSPGSIDNRYPDDLIQHYFIQARNLLLRRKLNKNQLISQDNYDAICLPTYLDNYFDCDCTLVPDQCKVLKVDIPPHLVKDSSNMLSVTTLGGTVIDKTSHTMIKNQRYSNIPIGIMYDEQPSQSIIYNTLNLKWIRLKLLLTNPLDLELDCGQNPQYCKDPKDRKFNIDADLVIPTYDMTIKLLQPRQAEDKIGDSTNA